MKNSKTPSGKHCVVPVQNSRLAVLITSQANGSWQRNVANKLVETGYIVGYQATGSALRGKAGNYRGHYDRSLANLIARIRTALNDNGAPVKIASGSVGPKSGYGYYISR
jgi:hypothetical protein